MCILVFVYYFYVHDMYPYMFIYTFCNIYLIYFKDNLVMDEPCVRRQVRRYGDEMLETIVDMDESQEEILDILPSRGKKGWTKLECFKIEKALLVYGSVVAMVTVN